MLALAVSPCILLAAWLTTRPAVAVVGAGTFIVFLMHIGFNSVYSANPEGFINDVIADLLAVLVSGAMYGLIDISSSAWSRRRIANSLRNLVVSACREPLALRRTRLEAAARDLVQRAGSPQRIGEAEDRVVIEWLLSTLEIGHAVIALREHLQAIHDHSLSASLRASLEAIAELHASPSRAGRLAAAAAVEGTAAMLTRNAAQPGMPPSVRRQLPTMLHFIRSALQDDTSVLALQENR